MKTKLVTTMCALAIGMCSINYASATEDKAATAAFDAIVVRPVSFVATVLGTAAFVVSLPVAAVSKSVKQTANALVVTPGRLTFTRPIGDFSDMSD